MRSFLIAFVLASASVVANLGSAQAQYNSQWCTDGAGRGNGILRCAYRTYEQCMQSLQGQGRSCVRNPDYRGEERRGRPN